MPQTNSDLALYILIGIAATALLLLAVGAVHAFFYEFTRELRYLNREIERSNGSDRRYWERRKRRLWLSILPFIKY
ncbi:MAG: hypothetical protein IJO75_02670 [Clostridia bacterium]|nr:hypothetical protein [Clostridia bacterium]